jgi:very-short-patch-repair endonuclease
MNERLAAIAADQSGVFGIADAERVGVSSDDLTGMVRRSEVYRVRRGAYVLAATYAPALPSERYLLRVKAVLRSRGAEHRASHHSALALLGIETFGARDDVIAMEHRSALRVRTKAGVAVHPWSNGPSWTVGPFRCVAPATACVQVAAAAGFIPGVCAMDSALRHKRLLLEDLTAALPAVPLSRRSLVGRAIAAADALSESVGETRTRIILLDAGFTVRSQVERRDGEGFIGRVDFLVDDCVVVEFDGLQKYAGLDGHRALAAEKSREERLTRLGYEVVRIVWSELEDPAGIVARVRRARRLAQERLRARSALGV